MLSVARATPSLRIIRRMTTMATDPSTQSNYQSFRTKHIRARLTVDFKKRCLFGDVRLRLDALAKAPQVVLDTSYLDIQKVIVASSL